MYLYPNYFIEGCERFGMVKTDALGIYMEDGCKIFEDDEIKDGNIVGEKLLFLDEKSPAVNRMNGNIFLALNSCIQ